MFMNAKIEAEADPEAFMNARIEAEADPEAFMNAKIEAEAFMNAKIEAEAGRTFHEDPGIFMKIQESQREIDVNRTWMHLSSPTTFKTASLTLAKVQGPRSPAPDRSLRPILRPRGR